VQAHLWGSKVQVVDAVQVHVLDVPAEERLHTDSSPSSGSSAVQGQESSNPCP